MECDEEKVRLLAEQFRAAILSCDRRTLFISLQEFPDGACGDASYLLARYLNERGCGTLDYVLGIRSTDHHSHAWLEQDGIIIDITADQFDGVNNEVVLVTSDKSWHIQFEEEDRHIADFDRYDANTVSNLERSYMKVVSKI